MSKWCEGILKEYLIHNKHFTFVVFMIVDITIIKIENVKFSISPFKQSTFSPSALGSDGYLFWERFHFFVLICCPQEFPPIQFYLWWATITLPRRWHEVRRYTFYWRRTHTAMKISIQQIKCPKRGMIKGFKKHKRQWGRLCMYSRNE